MQLCIVFQEKEDALIKHLKIFKEKNLDRKLFDALIKHLKIFKEKSLDRKLGNGNYLQQM